jgi:hypothetical protein
VAAALAKGPVGGEPSAGEPSAGGE